MHTVGPAWRLELPARSDFISSPRDHDAVGPCVCSASGTALLGPLTRRVAAPHAPHAPQAGAGARRDSWRGRGSSGGAPAVGLQRGGGWGARDKTHTPATEAPPGELWLLCTRRPVLLQICTAQRLLLIWRPDLPRAPSSCSSFARKRSHICVMIALHLAVE